LKASNQDVEGRVLEFAGREYMVRGRGYLTSVDDIARITVGTGPGGTPIRVSDVAQVRIGPDIRRGVAELDGEGEVVGGIVVMRFGENALRVINRVKARLREVSRSLPAGVRIVPTYDRSWLIGESIKTLGRSLLEESVVVSLVILLFLFHLRSAMVPILVLPLAVLASFVPMYYLGITSNIMSLGGLALAIGVLVDASIVMVENAYRHVSDRQVAAGTTDAPTDVIVAAAQQVGRAIFFSLAIIIVSFVPVFLLEAQEGRMFRPLAFTKTFAMLAASILSITLVPMLMTVFIRGRLRPESENPISRAAAAIYEPILRLALRWKWTALLLNAAVVPMTAFLLVGIGSEFMPPLYEGAILYMPTSAPGLSVTEATRLLQIQDRVLRKFPEVDRVFGSVGRGYQPHRQLADGHGQHHHHSQAAGAVAAGDDAGRTAGRDGCGAADPRVPERVDAADSQPARHAADGHQDAGGREDSWHRSQSDRKPGTGPGARVTEGTRHPQRVCRAGGAGIFHRHHDRP
jgi:Cu(I)/Ag(I) efflux system membrane protein CusA/SilA